MQVNRIVCGDCLDVMKTLPDGCVQCCVTSPPYWGLRDYGVEGQMGLEKTPEEYVASIVQVFREVKRVLRDDGTLWLNMGDSYIGGGRGFREEDSSKQATNVGSLSIAPTRGVPGFKPKDLCGIPWRVAFALQANGWWLRQDIIWHKPNPMPESCTDRCTKAHEYLFLLTKSAKYYWDQEAIKEDGVTKNMTGHNITDTRLTHGKMSGGNQGFLKLKAKYHELGVPTFGRNKRSVWTIPTHAFPEAHFATFPPKLVEPCILAGTSDKGCCPECGKSWMRVLGGGKRSIPAKAFVDHSHDAVVGCSRNTLGGQKEWDQFEPKQTIGWQPQCDHGHKPVSCVVLDPFMGSGTTAIVAQNIGRNWIGIELNPEYVKIAEDRIKQETQQINMMQAMGRPTCNTFSTPA
jgi:DNA modification methylase